MGWFILFCFIAGGVWAWKDDARKDREAGAKIDAENKAFMDAELPKPRYRLEIFARRRVVFFGPTYEPTIRDTGGGTFRMLDRRTSKVVAEMAAARVMEQGYFHSEELDLWLPKRSIIHVKVVKEVKDE